MILTVGSTVNITNPTEQITQWCKKNLILTNPEYARKLRMGKWTGNTPKEIQLYEKRGNTLVLPYGTLKPILSLTPAFEYALGTFKEPVSVNYNACVPLYDYQEKAVESLLKADYGILQSPAGSGKTQMGIALTARLGARTLWLTHTKDLLVQSIERAERYIDSSLIGTITEGKVNIGEGMTFATVQTMCNIDLTTLKDYWDVIIVDECHHCFGSPTQVRQFYKILNNLRARHKFGLSATVHRSDGLIKSTYALLGEIVYTVPPEEVADKIMKVGVVRINTGTEITDACLNTDGTLNYAKLISHLCTDRARNEMIIAWLSANKDNPSLILSERIEHLELLMSMLPAEMAEKAVFVNGKMTSKKEKEERQQALDNMRSGKKQYLFATYALAKEGLDIPRLENLYLTTPQKDYAVITQAIGRIARACENKQNPVCFDFVDKSIYCVKAYKKRCTTYRKNNCNFINL